VYHRYANNKILEPSKSKTIEVFFLSDIIIFAKSISSTTVDEENVEKNLQFVLQIELKDCTVENLPDTASKHPQKHAIKITQEDSSWRLSAPNQQEKQKWLDKLDELCAVKN